MAVNAGDPKGIVAKGDGPRDPTREAISKLCREVLAPLVRADGGRLYLVSADSDDVVIHLSGTCAGCPGASITRDRMLEPAIRTVAPKAKLRVSTGWRIPVNSESFD